MSVLAVLAASGSSAAGIVLQDGSIVASGIGAQTATVRVNTDGYVYFSDGGGFIQQYQWKQNGNASSTYDVRVDAVAGTVSGTTGSWLNLATTRDWSESDASNDGIGEFATILMQIRDASTLIVIAQAYFDLYAERTG